MDDLFADQPLALPATTALAEGAWLLRARALHEASALIDAVEQVALRAPFRQLVTPGGRRMSVETTSCGHYGWVSDPHAGYRYTPVDPMSGRRWPIIPERIARLAAQVARETGYDNFAPDTCLINRYMPDARMALHQDKDERDMQWPIVSISLGLTAIFQFGGAARQDPVQNISLLHGDIVVWGGPSRLYFHGIKPLRWGEHPQTGECRLNLTLRRTH